MFLPLLKFRCVFTRPFHHGAHCRQTDSRSIRKLTDVFHVILGITMSSGAPPCGCCTSSPSCSHLRWSTRVLSGYFFFLVSGHHGYMYILKITPGRDKRVRKEQIWYCRRGFNFVPKYWPLLDNSQVFFKGTVSPDKLCLEVVPWCVGLGKNKWRWTWKNFFILSSIFKDLWSSYVTLTQY